MYILFEQLFFRRYDSLVTQIVILIPLIFGLCAGNTVAQHPEYEVNVGYQAAFLTAGDYRAHSIEGSMARTLSEWNGLQVKLGIQQVPTDVDLPTAARSEPFEQGWQDLRTYVFDLLLFLDVLTLSTNRVEQHFRLHVGPSLKHRRGEQAHLLLRPKFIEMYPETVEAHIEEGNYDYLYRQSIRAPGIEDGEYVLFSDDVRQWAGGGTFGFSYSLTYQRFSVGFEGLARIYSNKHKIYTYGLHLGYLL